MKRLIFTIGIIGIIVIGVLAYFQRPIQQVQVRELTLGADSGALSPQTMADDATVGNQSWLNPDNAKVSDNVYANAVITHSYNPVHDAYVQIVKSNGTIGTTNKADTFSTWASDGSYTQYGSSTDLWGETWAATDINNSNFGVAFAANKDAISHYLKATNFGFSIPTGATINGILFEVQKYNQTATLAEVDHIRITVFFTESATNSCSYSGVGNWDVLGSDACYITSNVYVNGEFNLIGGSFGCADGVKISATKFNFGTPTEMETGCMAWHQ